MGWGNTFKKSNRSCDWDKSGGNRALSHALHFDKTQNTVNENEGHVEHILNICKAQNIRVYMIISPIYKTYYEKVDSIQYNQMVYYCDSISDKYPHVRYKNFMTDKRFCEDDFFDADHLNE